MFIKIDRIHISSKGDTDIIDITAMVAAIVKKHGLVEGSVLVFVPGATGGLTTVEYEPGLLKDLPEAFERLAPERKNYHHDQTWHDGNGHSHVRASLVGPSLTVPVEDGKLTLGTWQQIVFIDFDIRPRTRVLVVQLSGVKS